MILVLSRRRGDTSTDQVMDWLVRLGAHAFRLNAEDLSFPSAFSFEPARGILHLEDAVLRLGEVRAVWYRRWTSFEQYHQEHVAQVFDDHHRQYDLMRYLAYELGAVGEALFAGLRHAHWLGDAASSGLDKSRALAIAAELGLAVPETIIASTKAALVGFAARHPGVITKSLSGRPFQIAMGAEGLAAYTAPVDRSTLAAAPEVFFPSLLQERIDKAYEIRSFVLADRVRSMAIFSQADARTATDFRHYPDDHPNRCVPYQLPAEIEGKLLALMRRLGLSTGSADLIRARDGRHVFLEVNPVGQFGMVSGPCHYHLERDVATYLMDHDR